MNDNDNLSINTNHNDQPLQDHDNQPQPELDPPVQQEQERILIQVRSPSETLEEYTKKFKEKEMNAEIKVLKFFLCIVGIVMMAFLNNYSAFFLEPVACFNDVLTEDLFGGLNHHLASHLSARNGLIISGSLLIDLTILAGAVYYCGWGESWRLILSLILFYGGRAVFQGFYTMDFPVNDLFVYPGFPSLFVGYLPTNDFFFSGHVGLPILMGFELRRLKSWMLYVTCVISLYQGIVMMVTRGHFGVDCYFGWIAVFYVVKVVRWICVHLDKACYLGNLPEYPAHLYTVDLTPKPTRKNSMRLNDSDLEKSGFNAKYDKSHSISIYDNNKGVDKSKEFDLEGDGEREVLIKPKNQFSEPKKDR